jgi:hypothetical protein
MVKLSRTIFGFFGFAVFSTAVVIAAFFASFGAGLLAEVVATALIGALDTVLVGALEVTLEGAGLVPLLAGFLAATGADGFLTGAAGWAALAADLGAAFLGDLASVLLVTTVVDLPSVVLSDGFMQFSN